MRLLLLLLFFSLASLFVSAGKTSSFTIDYENDRFLLDGKPFQYISGSVHYFRIHPSQWLDRIKKIRALGFNAIQYYIPWNFHEIEEGKYVFDGQRDFRQFSQVAMANGLYTLLRIGPYICGEWENGGLPWWLLNKGDIKQRSNDEKFTREVEKWFSLLLPMIKPMLREHGGPVLMVQIENEYGSYDACDQNYTIWLRDLTRKYLGDNVVLYTTDGGSEGYLKCGAIPGVYPTVDFGPSSEKGINSSFAAQRKYLPNGRGPLVNSEFYPGWLLLWGQKTQDLPSGKLIVDSAKCIFNMGANINFYMIHGGTNFGFWNGAEANAPCVTSYDYGAPLSEAGDITPNYVAIRNWIKTIPNWKNAPTSIPQNSSKRAYGSIRLKPFASPEVFSAKCLHIQSENPLSFEQLKQPMGFVMYYTRVQECGKNLTIPMFKDYGFVYLDKTYQGMFINRLNDATVRSINLTTCPKDKILYILVENQGRQTYETINDYKGILSNVLLDGKELKNWTHCPLTLPLDIGQYRNKLSYQPFSAGNTGIYSGWIEVDKVADTFIDTTGWGKGVIFINRFNLGRYWASLGPQMTLYIPAALLTKGLNSIYVLELQGANRDCHDGYCAMESVENPIYTYQTRKSPYSLSHYRNRKAFNV